MDTSTQYPGQDDTVANNGWFAVGALGVNADLERTDIAGAFADHLGWKALEDDAINGATLNVVPDLKLVRREDTDRVIGWGHKSLHVIQNSTCRDILLAGLADVDAQVAAIGSLRNGARTFVAVSLGEAGNVNVDGDKIEPYMVLGNSFDGSSTLRLLNLAVRPGCTNVLNMTLRQRSATLATIRHTSGAEGRFAEVKSALRRFLTIRDEFQADVERLIATTVTPTQADKAFNLLAPMPKGEDATKAAVTRAERRREGLWDAYFDQDRNGYQGSAWGLFQAWSTWSQNDAGFRKTKNGPLNIGERKIEKALDGCKAEYAGISVIDRVLADA